MSGLFLRSAVFWSLFPFVLPQALRVRKRAPRFSDARGPKQGRVGNGRSLALLAVGDSIIAGVGAATLPDALVGQTATSLARTLECAVSWSAHGRTGANTASVCRELVPELPTAPADFIIVSVGVNDVTAMSSLRSWARDLDTLVCALKRHSPAAAVAVAGIPPFEVFPLLPQPMRALFGFRGRTFGMAARATISRYPRVTYVPIEIDPRPDNFATDGFHPSEVGYAEFGQAMASSLVDTLARVRLPSGAGGLTLPLG